MADRQGRIRLLPDALVDQIAAGEVVERPASVVKELVENALDAEARKIRIDVREGGKALVAVTDDGFGMSPAEARLAFSRHATSKIRDLEDLERVGSFGFRGEALPAIASVSRLRLFSRSRGAAEGYEIRVEAGEVQEERPAGGPEGTRIEVADLFVRIPARRKFLKTGGTEWGHIADWLGRLALALPGVHFELRRDDRPPAVWPATSEPHDRIAAVLGEQEASALSEVECEDAGGHLQAFVSSPEHTRANANGIYMFVNGRPVRDKVMRHALLQAYRDLIPRGRFPSAVLFLTLPPGAVDVNVHPAKWEVRFAEPQAIHQLIRRAVRQAMGERSWLGGATHIGAGAPGPHEAAPVRGGFESAAFRATRGRPEDPVGEVRERGAGDWVLASPGPEARPALPGLERAGAVEAAESESGALRFMDLRLVGQLLAAYLLVEAKDGLLLVDQHAAHERVLYERLRRQGLEQGVERQGLLLPVTLELEPLAAAALQENAELVAKLGFEVEPFGDASVMVRALPALLAGQDPATLVRSLAGELEAGPGSSASGKGDESRLLPAIDRIFATLACHSARRAGDHLDAREQQQILDDLDTIPWAPTCPHGRPVAVSYGMADIERRFGRR